MWLPFSYSTPALFVITLLAQILTSLISLNIIGIYLGIIIGITIASIAQFRILNHRLKNIYQHAILNVDVRGKTCPTKELVAGSVAFETNGKAYESDAKNTVSVKKQFVKTRRKRMFDAKRNGSQKWTRETITWSYVSAPRENVNPLPYIRPNCIENITCHDTSIYENNFPTNDLTPDCVRNKINLQKRQLTRKLMIDQEMKSLLRACVNRHQNLLKGALT